MQDWFCKKKLPSIVVGSSGKHCGLSSVDIDYRAVCRHAGGALRGLGHRQMALILPDSSTGGEADSEAGFLEAAEPFDDTSPQIIRHDGSADHLRFLLQKAMSRPNHPTGIVVGRCVHALTVLTFLQRAGISVPEQVSVISRDSEEYLEHLTPRMACYFIEPARIIRRIVRAVREVTESKSRPVRQTRLMPDFLPGETLAKPPRN